MDLYTDVDGTEQVLRILCYVLITPTLPFCFKHPLPSFCKYLIHGHEITLTYNGEKQKDRIYVYTLAQI